MQARNHVPFAMSSWWLYALAMNYPIEAFGTLFAGLGGLLPDIDHPESTLGRRVKLISVPLAALFGHRGYTHSLLAVVMLVGLLIAVTTQLTYQPLARAIAPLTIGYLSHLLGDSFTPSGIPLLYPLKQRFSFNLFKTFSWQETAFTAVLTLGLLTFGGVAFAVWESFLQSLPQSY